MNQELERLIDRYAKVIVDVGLNLQRGQGLLIGSPLYDGATPLEAAPLVRRITKHAYRRGARLVHVLWGDDEVSLIRAKHADVESLGEFPTWQVNAVREAADQGDALLTIYAHNPDLYDGCDAERLDSIERSASANTAPLFEIGSSGKTNWSIVSIPVSGWSEKMFPGTSREEATAKLWRAIFDACRVNAPDPVTEWKDHVSDLNRRAEYLNHKRYRRLHYTTPGTDLNIVLPQGHVWKSGAMANARGIDFVANIPTEEVFTLPAADATEGTVTATRPFNLGTVLAKDFTLRFSHGRVVKVEGTSGIDGINRIIATDAGAARLGEVALVPDSSPISRTKMMFYNILIDENASCHLALGHAYKLSLEGGEAMSDDEFVDAGGNLSSVHADFMIGSRELSVDGFKEEGIAEPVMRNGEWAFTV